MAEEARFRLRIRYAKLGRLRFLSHLEVMRTVMRIVRRAGLPYAISQGFSPHMKAAFSAALPVGCAGLDEYLDVQLTEYVDPAFALCVLQEAAPDSLPVLGCAYIGFDVPALTAGYPVMTYRALVDPGAGEGGVQRVSEALGRLMDLGCVTVVRKGKEKSILLSEKLIGVPQVRPLAPDPNDLSGAPTDPCLVELRFATLTTENGALRADVFADAVAGQADPALHVRWIIHEETFGRLDAQTGRGEERPL